MSSLKEVIDTLTNNTTYWVPLGITLIFVSFVFNQILKHLGKINNDKLIETLEFFLVITILSLALEKFYFPHTPHISTHNTLDLVISLSNQPISWILLFIFTTFSSMIIYSLIKK